MTKEEILKYGKELTKVINEFIDKYPTYNDLLDLVLKLDKELQQKEEIIKEAREYIEKNKHLNWYVESCYVNDLLQILDGDSNE